jgi:hypothetical protein
MALMLALNSPELDVRAITVVPGNVTAAQGLDNALRLVSLANRRNVPVAAVPATFRIEDSGQVNHRQQDLTSRKSMSISRLR